jgi:hypothetical protein
MRSKLLRRGIGAAGKFCRGGRFFREGRVGEGLESLILQGFC